MPAELDSATRIQQMVLALASRDSPITLLHTMAFPLGVVKPQNGDRSDALLMFPNLILPAETDMVTATLRV
jgi:hypothetical protein